MRIPALALCAALLLLEGCSLFGGKGSKLDRVPSESMATGRKYNDGGFEVKEFNTMEAAPGLAFVEGGTFIMGQSQEDIEHSFNALNRQVTVASFYLDESEVTNVMYREFLYDMKDSATKYQALLPDTTVWYRELAYNDPYIESYFQHPGFNMYPVVGVNWYQANEFCLWRTEAVNKDRLQDDANAVTYPNYRLPTEAEWEYAARGGLEQSIYPWEGKSLRDLRGSFMTNFKRGRGDYAGRSNAGAGSNMVEGLNDGYMITAPVGWGPANAFGLYNMSGNVAEWCYDTYRALSYEDVEDLNPVRRRGRTANYRTSDTDYNEKYSLLYDGTPAQSPLAYQDSTLSSFDYVKVVRGGSWSDEAYYITIGYRSFQHADSASARVGFRCAMIKVGSPY